MRRTERVTPSLRKLALGFWVLLSWGILVAFVTSQCAADPLRDALPPESVIVKPWQERAWSHIRPYSHDIPVLLYHGINSEGDYLSISPRLFARHMAMLRTAGFQSVSIRRFSDFMNGKSVTLPRRPILITFDDGRFDSWQYAQNVLRRNGFEATMFIVPEFAVTSPEFHLTWPELLHIDGVDQWEVELHAGTGHRYIRVDAEGHRGEFYAFRRFSTYQHELESFSDYKRRVRKDIFWGMRQLHTHLAQYRPVGFSIPFSNYGTQKTNDPRIGTFLLRLLRANFDTVFSGDYLHLSRESPPFRQLDERKLAYRISIRHGMTASLLHCRLRAWTANVTLERERTCY